MYSKFTAKTNENTKNNRGKKRTTSEQSWSGDILEQRTDQNASGRTGNLQEQTIHRKGKYLFFIDSFSFTQ